MWTIRAPDTTTRCYVVTVGLACHTINAHLSAYFGTIYSTGTFCALKPLHIAATKVNLNFSVQFHFIYV